MSLTPACGFAQSPPFANTLAAGPVTATNALINGFATPNGLSSVAWFEWGPNFRQKSSVTNVGAGAGVVHVRAWVTDLIPGQSYDFRVVVSNSAGIVYSAPRRLATGRKVFVWGRNYQGSGQTNFPAGLSNVVAISAIDESSIVLSADGTISAWGDYYKQSKMPLGLQNVAAVACGIDHDLALRSDGTVVAWGNNSAGQTNVPPGLTNAVAIAAGGGHSLALRADGSVVGWGYNYYGQTNVPVGLSNVVAIAAGPTYSLAARADGTVVAWGDNSRGQRTVPSGLNDAVAVAAGYGHSLALRRNGRVVGWGFNDFGQASPPASLSNVIAIAGGYAFSVALKSDGIIVPWGGEIPAETNPPPNAVDCAALCAGWYSVVELGNRAPVAFPQTVSGPANHDLVITLTGNDPNGDGLGFRIRILPVEGELYQYESSRRGARIFAPGAPVTDAAGRVIFVPAANAYHNPYSHFTFAANDGEMDSVPATVTISIFGAPYAATRPPVRVNSTAATLTGMATPNGFPTTAWFELGTNYELSTAATNVGSGDAVVYVTARLQDLAPRANHRCRLVVSNETAVVYGAEQRFSTGSKVTAWGSNEKGQATIPARLSDVVAMEGGSLHSIALQSDGTILAWGEPDSGKTTIPPGLSNAIAISAGAHHNLALKADGTVQAWGLNSDGQTTVPPHLVDVASIAAGWFFNLALRANGTVVAWGNNVFGQTNVPSGLSNVTAIAAGGYHGVALKADGTVATWGDNGYSQTNVPGGLSNVAAIGAGAYDTVALRADATLVRWGNPWTPLGLSNVVAFKLSYSDGLAVNADGTVTQWGSGSQTNIPGQLRNVPVVAAGALHYLALGNVPPQAQSQTVSAAANHDVPIPLSASDINGETLVLWITALPANGQLLQYDGSPINTPWTMVQDLLGRVIFRPAPDAFGSPYATFSFVANDGDVDSAPATVTVNILGALYAHTQRPWVTSPTRATLNGMVVANGFATEAWFEWSGGQSTPVSAGDGGAVVRVTEGISGLAAGQTLWCRLVASNANGIVYGARQLFSTGKKLAVWGNNSYGEGKAPAPLSDVVAAAGGWVHSAALRSDGTVLVWGDNSQQQTNLPPGLNSVVAISAESKHTLALKADGTVAAWGSYTYTRAFDMPNWSNISAIACGQDHDLALRNDGTIVSIGSYGYNQVTVPAGLSNVVAIAAGGNHDLALRADGTVVAFGDNYNNWLTPPAGLSNVIAIATSWSHSLALRADGTVVAWGDNSAGQTNVPADLTDVVAIACRQGHNLALKQDGTLVGWGSTFVPPSVAPGLTGVVAIAEGNAHSLAIGDNVAPGATPQTVFVPINRDWVIMLSGTDINTDALRYRITSFPGAGSLYQYLNGVVRGPPVPPDGTVSDSFGRMFFVPGPNQFGRPYTSFNFVANDGTADSLPAPVVVVVEGLPFAFTHAAEPITANTSRLNGVARAGPVPTATWFEWGSTRNYGQATAQQFLPAGNSFVWLNDSIAGLTANAVYHCRLVASNAGGIAYGQDRTFTTGRKPNAWGNPFYGENLVPTNVTNVVTIAAGRNHVLALRNDGTVVGWGGNGQNQIIVPDNLSNVVAIAAGNEHSLGLTGDGRVVAWGRADIGLRAVPTGGAKRIAAGNLHSVALMNDGRVVAWGYNQDGQTNVPPGLNNVVAIAAANSQSMALRSDGRVFAWGGGASLSNVPPAATNVVAIACNGLQNMAIKVDGSVVLWGSATNVPADWTNVVELAGVLALKHNGTVSANITPDNFAVGRIPERLTNAAAVASTYQYAVAIGNLPPTAYGSTNQGAANHDLAIQLTGSDPQEDALNFRILSLPSKGALYQYSDGTRGGQIAAANTPVTDLQGRLIFAPGADEFGDAYASFSFVANDGEMDSTQAVVRVRIVATAYAVTQAAAPVGATNAVLNGMVLANGFPTTAWFEWGTNAALGQSTPPVSTGAGATVVRVSVPVEGLSSNAVFWFSLVASNRVNAAYGGVQMFTTGRRPEAWGRYQQGQTYVPANFKGAVAVFADTRTSYAIRNDGTVGAWGYSVTNGFPAGLSNVIAVTEGMALKSDGTLIPWGENYSGETNIPPGSDNVIAIASGSARRMALRADGTVVAWGADAFVPPGLKNIAAIAMGSAHRLALNVDGTVIAWGLGFNGETNVPVTVSNVVDIAAAGNSSFALRADGRVIGWGYDPAVSGASNAIDVASGVYHRLMLQADGTLRVFGNVNADGQLNKPASLTTAAAIAAGSFHSIVLRENRRPTTSSRSIVGTPNFDLVIDLPGFDADNDGLFFRITSLPARGQLYQYTNGTRGAAITAPDTQVIWGARLIFTGVTNELGNNYAAFSFVVSDGEADSAPGTVTISLVGTAYAATLAPSSVTSGSAMFNGMAVANGLATLAWFEWGNASAPFAQRTAVMPVHGGAGIVHVSEPLTGLVAGTEYRYRLVVSNSTRVATGWEQRFKTGSKFVSWGGTYDYTQSKIPALGNVVSLAAGNAYSLALLTDGTMQAWGVQSLDNTSTNVPPGLSNVVAIAAGPEHALALRSNGTVVSWGGYRNTMTNVPPNISNIVAIAAGDRFSVGLRKDGSIVSWGSFPPFNFVASNFVAIAAGYGHVVALRIDGAVVAWGPIIATNVPARLTNAVAIAAGGQNNSMALRADGTVTNWGIISGVPGPPANLSNVVHIAAGENHRLALRGDGSVVGWGNNDAGRLNPPPDLAGVVQLSGGSTHTLALAGNVAPVAGPQQAFTFVNHDAVITLNGGDANGDALMFLAWPPNRGALYQHVGGARGAPILAPSLVDDPLGRVMFAPELDRYGQPFPSFTFLVGDGETASAPATVTVFVNLPRAPVINARSSRRDSDGSFRLDFSGDAATYTVHASTNLLGWEKLGFATNTGPGLFRFVEPAGPWPQRFYRAGAP